MEDRVSENPQWQPVWEVRSDQIAGFSAYRKGRLKQTGFGPGRRGSVNVRWMTPREYARLQGAGDFRLDAVTPLRRPFSAWRCCLRTCSFLGGADPSGHPCSRWHGWASSHGEGRLPCLRTRTKSKSSSATAPAPAGSSGDPSPIAQAFNQVANNGRTVGAAKHGVYIFYDYDGEPIYTGQTYEGLQVE